jgi:hypothetical protein
MKILLWLGNSGMELGIQNIKVHENHIQLLCSVVCFRFLG